MVLQCSPSKSVIIYYVSIHHIPTPAPPVAPVVVELLLCLVVSSLLMLREVFFTVALRLPKRHDSDTPKRRIGMRILVVCVKVLEVVVLSILRYLVKGAMACMEIFKALFLKNDLPKVKPYDKMPLVSFWKPTLPVLPKSIPDMVKSCGRVC